MLHSSHEFHRRAMPIFRVFVECLQNFLLDGHRDFWIFAARWWWRVTNMAEGNFHWRVASKGWFTREQFVKNDCQRVNITLRQCFVRCSRLLWRDITRRAESGS